MDKGIRVSEEKLAAAEYSDRICLNYIDFLSASCKKRWSFVDAIYGVIPFFGMITRKSATSPPSSSEPLKDLALQIISTQVSDEINIARLITLAQQQHIGQFDILMPYPLSESQLVAIRQEYARPLKLEQLDDRLSVILPQLTH
ncbi:hypothetical protein FVB43_09275 [Erwinia rhapontici]|uniref:hypothetical protein n=1 Tax=Erwinia rhapontici TaxID=55212 RepID=UPI0018D5CAA9|nr:hypothetical protein [Erwinia rhapontici]NKG30231.1 hypothetical protein [Erwinia rhapontici]